MNVFDSMPKALREAIVQGAKGKSLFFPESEDPRIATAASVLGDAFGVSIFLGNKETVAKHSGLTRTCVLRTCEKRQKPAPSDIESLVANPFYTGGALLDDGKVDAVVGGAVATTAEVIRAALSTVGLNPTSSLITSAFLFSLAEPTAGGEKIVLYADCGVIPNPSAAQLSQIAYLAAMAFTRWTGAEARVAFLSFSTVGSASHPDVEKVQKAFENFKKDHPEVLAEGELQFDAATVPAIAARKNPQGKLRGRANVFIFPDLDAGNIAYKVTQRLAGAEAWGPILLGTAKPFSDLSRGASVEDIVQISLLTLALS